MIDLAAWAEQVKAAAIASLESSGQMVATRAKQKAPVRKIFAGGRRRLRFRTAAEVSADAPLRAALGLGPETAAPEGFQGMPSRHRKYARTVTVGNLLNMRAPAAWRRIGRPGHLRMAAAEDMLDRRGRAEVKSGRAEYHGKIGGRLKGEITSTEARMDGSRIVVEVISPTEYAKFQEFGTRHNPAHPFLRPALEEGRSEIVTGMKQAISQAAGRPVAGGRSRKKVRVNLKAGA